MSSMNLLNMKKEIQNLNNIVYNLKNENKDLKDKLEVINNEIIDVKIKKPSIIEITSFVDDIREEMTLLSNKLDEINRKRFLKEIITLDKYNEAYIFLKQLNIEEKTINVLLFLNNNTINDLCNLNIEEFLPFNISRNTIEYIVTKACETISN
tara:strand:+ start:192 stop:650 length:459 start_codon:yes stop_codon:yes gene_type:complete